jgi:trk system potassium uptake protein TrkA
MKEFVVIGLGRFGSSVATHLCKMGHEVLGIDLNEERVQHLSNMLTYAVVGDATDEDLMKSLGVRNFDVAVVSIGEDIQASILATIIIKDIGVPYIVAKALNDLHGKVLEKIGADRVVYPEREMGQRIANNLVSTNILDYIELSPEYSIMEIIATNKLTGKTLGQLNLRALYGINVIALKRDKQINASPGANDMIHVNDILVVMGRRDVLENLKSK